MSDQLDSRTQAGLMDLVDALMSKKKDVRLDPTIPPAERFFLLDFAKKNGLTIEWGI